ncbi:MAG: DUF4031 domain-containing protein [Hyphomicrobium sp.]|uniref:DUF4031 domain-containing protein n=1 Tax=Hyphomicrobium sp. TaxID=82 RepID=UPI003D13C278
MAVYVDTMRAGFLPTHVKGRRYVMSHLFADTREELFAMVDKIGVDRQWFQRPPGTGLPGMKASWEHFDITQSKKRLAIAVGAVEVSMEAMAAWNWHRETFGFACHPDVALEKRESTRRAKATETAP